jgi:hypothetical protein
LPRRQAAALKDPQKAKEEMLGRLLATSSRQLDESEKNIDDIKSVMAWAKSPRERTAMNIILDDQKKVAKALERLVNDLAEMSG